MSFALISAHTELSFYRTQEGESVQMSAIKPGVWNGRMESNGKAYPLSTVTI